MKKILFLLLSTVAMYGQVPADATPLENIQITNNQTSTTATKVNVQENDGTINTKPISELANYLEFSTAVNLPVTGEQGKLYLTKDNNRLYRFNGTIYQELTTDITYQSVIDALTFTPENVANKSNSYTVSSTTTYPNTKALVDGLGTKQNTLTNPVTGTFVAGRVSYSSSNSTLTDSSKLLWDNTNSYFEVNGNAPRFTLKNNLNNFSTYFTNNADGTLFLKNHQDKTLAVFSNPVNSTEQPQMAIGKVSSIPVESQLYVYGGMNGANIDARGSNSADESNLDLENSDWLTNPKSIGLSTFGDNFNLGGDILGYERKKSSVLRFSNDKSFITSLAPIKLGINNLEIGNINSTGIEAISFTKSSAPATNILLAGGSDVAQNTAFNKPFGITAGTVVEGGTLGSNAYSSTAYLPLSGGALSGALTGTSANFSSNVTSSAYKLEAEGVLGWKYPSTEDTTMYNRITGDYIDGIKYYSGSWTSGNIKSHIFYTGNSETEAVVVYNNGSVKINNLSGSGDGNIVASSDGTLKRISDTGTITTSTNITTTTTVTGGESQRGKTILIANGANNIYYTINAELTASFVKGGTGTITFVKGSGRTLVAPSGAVFNGLQGSTASITSFGTTDYVYINNF